MKLTYSLESVLQNDFGEMTVCFGLEFQKFLSDLEFTADTDYRGYEEYPEVKCYNKVVTEVANKI